MIIIPAIDIKNGKCVRLVQGNFNQETIYNNNPLQTLRQFEQEGAKIVHLTDLDKAKDDSPVNVRIIRSFIKNSKISIQLAGGIKNEKNLEKALILGVKRVVISAGTALSLPYNTFKRMLEKYALRIVVSLDVKKGKLVKNAWQDETDLKLINTAKSLETMGVKRFIYTDVTKDGTLKGPNHDEVKKLLSGIKIPLIVAGGISSLPQIRKLKSIGVEGVIIGKALFENKIKLEEILPIC